MVEKYINRCYIPLLLQSLFEVLKLGGKMNEKTKKN